MFLFVLLITGSYMVVAFVTFMVFFAFGIPADYATVTGISFLIWFIILYSQDWGHDNSMH